MLLEVKKLSVHYGAVMALHEVSFHLESGEIVSLLGPNGAGKSTVLKAIDGLLGAYSGAISQGDIFFQGLSIKGDRTDELVRKGVSLVPEGRRVFPTLSVRENLLLGAFIRKDKNAIPADLELVLTLLPQLRLRLQQKAGTLSSGEQQMLAIGRALMLKPKLLLMDEPSLGLSPNYIELIFDKLKEINQGGTSILIVEQNARMALEISHRAYIFSIGRIVKEGNCAQLMDDEEVSRAYLGK